MSFFYINGYRISDFIIVIQFSIILNIIIDVIVLIMNRIKNELVVIIVLKIGYYTLTTFFISVNLQKGF